MPPYRSPYHYKLYTSTLSPITGARRPGIGQRAQGGAHLSYGLAPVPPTTPAPPHGCTGPAARGRVARAGSPAGLPSGARSLHGHPAPRKSPSAPRAAVPGPALPLTAGSPPAAAKRCPNRLTPGANGKAIAARDLLLEVVADFPFALPLYRAAWPAALLTPLARFAFAGPAPLFLVDANVRAAGKGLLLDTISPGLVLPMTRGTAPAGQPTVPPHHRTPRGTIVAPCGTLVAPLAPSWHCGGTVVAPSWHPTPITIPSGCCAFQS